VNHHFHFTDSFSQPKRIMRTVQMISVLHALLVFFLSISTNGFSTQHATTTATLGRAQCLRQTSMALSKKGSELESFPTRRGALRSIMGQGLATLTFISFGTKSASALDMDAFINSEVYLYSNAPCLEQSFSNP
jgi:hypothetical protein